MPLRIKTLLDLARDVTTILYTKQITVQLIDRSVIRLVRIKTGLVLPESGGSSIHMNY